MIQIYMCARFLSHVLLGFTEVEFIISKRSDSEESDYSFNCSILWVGENRLILPSCFLFIEDYI